MLSPELLRAATGCTQEDAERYADPLSEACTAYEITTPVRLAAFFGQLSHESVGLRHVKEIASGEAYEGRKSLGNTEPGDGPRYRGRGFIQVTGRSNYTTTRDSLRKWRDDVPDFVADPDAMEQPLWAAMSAADWWSRHGCNALADAGKYVQLGRLINRGNANASEPANGEADRLARWARARVAFDVPSVRPEEEPPRPVPFPFPLPDQPMLPGDAGDAPEFNTMPLPAILGALLPHLIEGIPKLAKIFGPGSAVAERNVKAAELAMQIAQQSIGATNAQETVEKIKADPAAAATVTQAIEARWFELAESGGGGIDGARKADAAITLGDGPWWAFLRSPSFWFLVLSLPLVYMIVGSIAGLWGYSAWSDDVRASLSTAVVSLVIGGAAGYFWGQNTSRNRTPAP